MILCFECYIRNYQNIVIDESNGDVAGFKFVRHPVYCSAVLFDSAAEIYYKHVI